MTNKILSEIVITRALNKLTHNISGMSYKIEESLTTSSFYITIYYHGHKRSARISDHISDNSVMKTLIIGKHTKRKTIESFLTNIVKTLIKIYKLKGELND